MRRKLTQKLPRTTKEEWEIPTTIRLSGLTLALSDRRPSPEGERGGKEGTQTAETAP